MLLNTVHENAIWDRTDKRICGPAINKGVYLLWVKYPQCKVTIVILQWRGSGAVLVPHNLAHWGTVGSLGKGWYRSVATGSITTQTSCIWDVERTWVWRGSCRDVAPHPVFCLKPNSMLFSLKKIHLFWLCADLAPLQNFIGVTEAWCNLGQPWGLLEPGHGATLAPEQEKCKLPLLYLCTGVNLEEYSTEHSNISNRFPIPLQWTQWIPHTTLPAYFKWDWDTQTDLQI